MAHPCGCGLFVLEGPGNCSGSSGRQWARRPRLSDGLFVDQGGVGLSRPQRPHFTTRTKIQGGSAQMLRVLPKGWFSSDYTVFGGDGTPVGQVDLSNWRETAKLEVGGERYTAHREGWRS